MGGEGCGLPSGEHAQAHGLHPLLPPCGWRASISRARLQCHSATSDLQVQCLEPPGGILGLMGCILSCPPMVGGLRSLGPDFNDIQQNQTCKLIAWSLLGACSGSWAASSPAPLWLEGFDLEGQTSMPFSNIRLTSSVLGASWGHTWSHGLHPLLPPYGWRASISRARFQ